MFTLKDVSEFLRTKPTKAYLAFIAQVRRLILFPEERANRLVRFQKIVADYKAGVPVKDIEAKYKCSTNTVLRHARIAGLEKRPKKQIAEDIDRNILIDLRMGHKLKTIATAYGVSESYVSILAKANGLSRYKPK